MSTIGADGAASISPGATGSPASSRCHPCSASSIARCSARSAMRCRHSCVGVCGIGSRWRSSTAVTSGSRSAAIASRTVDLPAPLAPDINSSTTSIITVWQRFIAGAGAHPVVSAVWRRCSMPTSIPAWSNGRSAASTFGSMWLDIPRPEYGDLSGSITATCWWSAAAIPGCGRHCMPPSEIRIGASCSSRPNGSAGRRPVATAASSTPA